MMNPVSGGIARSEWASSMKRRSVVPERGAPTMNGIGRGRGSGRGAVNPSLFRNHANMTTPWNRHPFYGFRELGEPVLASVPSSRLKSFSWRVFGDHHLLRDKNF